MAASPVDPSAPNDWVPLKQAFLDWVTGPQGTSEHSQELWRIFAENEWFCGELHGQALRALAAKKLPRDWCDDVQHEVLLQFAAQLQKDPALHVDIDRVDKTFPAWIGERLHHACGHALGRLQRLYRHHDTTVSELLDYRPPKITDLQIDTGCILQSLAEPLRTIVELDLMGFSLVEIAKKVGLRRRQVRRKRDKARQDLAERLVTYRMAPSAERRSMSSSSSSA